MTATNNINITGISTSTSDLWSIYPPALAKLAAQRVSGARTQPGPEQVRELMQGRQSQSVYPVSGGVAVINLSGVMTKYADWETAFFGGAVHTELESAVKAAAADPTVKAIMIRIDSPGGSVAGVSDLADAVFAARQAKPVVAYVSDLAASCGYYIASQCGAIYSDSDALIGCIGTISVIYDYSKMLEDAGIKAHVFTSEQDPNKGAGVPGSELTETQQAYIQGMVDDLGAKFVADIYRGRPKLEGSDTKLPDGRVHIADKALAMGLIDGIQSFDKTLADLQGSVAAAPAANKYRGDCDPAILARRMDLCE